MNAPIQRQTAQIFQFPPPGARDRAGRLIKTNAKQASHNFEMETSVDYGAWYHEAAMIEAERPRKS